MSSDLNKIILIGRLSKDPDLKYTQSGTPVASFSIATNYSYGSGNEKKNQVSFINCVAWKKTGELIHQYVKKGNRIAIDGRLQQRSWEKDGKKNYIVEIVVESCQFLEHNKNKTNEENIPPINDNNSFGGQIVNNAPPITDNNPFDDELF
jgi:single-strand DNA-binding protein